MRRAVAGKNKCGVILVSQELDPPMGIWEGGNSCDTAWGSKYSR